MDQERIDNLDESKKGHAVKKWWSDNYLGIGYFEDRGSSIELYVHVCNIPQVEVTINNIALKNMYMYVYNVHV